MVGDVLQAVYGMHGLPLPPKPAANTAGMQQPPPKPAPTVAPVTPKVRNTFPYVIYTWRQYASAACGLHELPSLMSYIHGAICQVLRAANNIDGVKASGSLKNRQAVAEFQGQVRIEYANKMYE